MSKQRPDIERRLKRVRRVAAGLIRMRAPKRVSARMMWNWLIDSTLGSIPIVGDLFDLFWKSNRRNVDLLQNHLNTKEQW